MSKKIDLKTKSGSITMAQLNELKNKAKFVSEMNKKSQSKYYRIFKKDKGISIITKTKQHYNELWNSSRLEALELIKAHLNELSIVVKINEKTITINKHNHLIPKDLQVVNYKSWLYGYLIKTINLKKIK